ncbi:MAG: DUF1549 and DUF1553 domain-containing protein [Gemmataceae bacterium]|nr:DUF1549 and DUF1553 domain-containing protein [Gemmataceae bacterium]
MGKRDLLFIGLLVGGAGALAYGLMPPRQTRPGTSHDASAYADPGFTSALARLDASFARRWTTAAPPAPDLQAARRLSLALVGTIPSLEEIRQLETLPDAERLPWWIDRLLKDPRSHEYLAERFARAFVGTEDGPFLLFRRRRLSFWLGEQLARNRSYDEMARELIASRGLWTNEPATNFVSVTARPAMQNQPDPVRLAGRTARAFLGIRLDCVECHDKPDHLPGRPWLKRDFHRLAAFFGQTRLGFVGIHDSEKHEYDFALKRGNEPAAIAPEAPCSPELLPAAGSRRQRLAAWITDAGNPYFARAAVNRLWAMMLGKPLVAPVDNLEAVPESEQHPALSMLADDFRANGHDLRRLIRLIASSRAFRIDSVGDADDWSVFPLTRLRPEQVAGSVIQASSVATIDQDSHVLVRLIRYANLNDFLQRYGDTGEEEFEERGGTIPQRLLLMNGQLVKERVRKDLFSAVSRIEATLKDDARAVETAYLTVLTRRPDEEERAAFVAHLQGPGDRADKMVDLFWALINTTEFSWNH